VNESAAHKGGAVLVIGSGGGIGSAVVQKIVQMGRSVVAVDVKPSSLADHGADVRPYELDGADRSGLAKVLASNPDVRHVINVAGGALPAEIDGEAALDEVVLAETMRINFETCLSAIDAVVCQVRSDTTGAVAEKSWSITLCSSINAVGSYSYPLYSASKSAIESLTSTMAVPLGQDGIRINCVRLGTVRTERSLDLHHNSTTHYARLQEQTALGRFVSASEAAAAFVHLTVHLTGCTGTVLTVDCGQSIPGPRP
jgi:NAD(P)-dependent dehydrogenase (short-subunit alcohol dehydrogenase family)